jgi:hypothetical protein
MDKDKNAKFTPPAVLAWRRFVSWLEAVETRVGPLFQPR